MLPNRPLLPKTQNSADDLSRLPCPEGQRAGEQIELSKACKRPKPRSFRRAAVAGFDANGTTAEANIQLSVVLCNLLWR